MLRIKERLLQIKMPHTYTLLLIILLSVVLMTYIIPSGAYERIIDPVTNRTVVIPDSFHYETGKRTGFFDIFLALYHGYVSATDIIFLILFAYGYVHILVDSGTLSSAISNLIRILGDRTALLIPVMMFIFGLLGSTMGIFEEVYGLIPVFISIGIALGYDRMVGGAIVYVGVATGFAAATTNPFSVGIAQSIADVPMLSGLGYRIIIFIVFQLASTAYVMWYAKRVKRDPSLSVLYKTEGEAFSSQRFELKKVTLRQKLSLLIFTVAIGMLLYGTSVLDWYIDEISALFLMVMVTSGLLLGYSPTKICQTFIESTKTMVSSILVVGFTRAILIVMQDAMISDTIVYYFSKLLGGNNACVSAVGMLAVQNIINFFITGSTSQATITIPIMSSVSDIIGISRQTAVLVYQFGDGFSDLFWPTACSLGCGLMGVPLDKWYKFITPLFLVMMALQVLFSALSVFVYT